MLMLKLRLKARQCLVINESLLNLIELLKLVEILNNSESLELKT